MNFDDADEREFLAANARLERRREELKTAQLARARLRDHDRLQKNKAWEITGGGEKLAALLKIAVKDSKRERRAARVDKIDEYAAAWHKINETIVQTQTLKVAYRNGFLTITLATPTLKNELENFLAPPLLSRLREELPHVLIRGLKFKCGAKK